MQQTESSVSGVTALLFDIGGVVIDVDFNRAFDSWSSSSGEPADVIRSRFEADTAFQRYEVGELGDREYFELLRRALQVDISEADVLEGWLAVFMEPMPGIESLLDKAANQLPLYALSNSNPTHWHVCLTRYSDLMDYFDNVFISFELGARKPEHTAYTYVLDRISRPADQVLFFDNSAANVDAALSLGIKAKVASSVLSITEELDRLGRRV